MAESVGFRQTKAKGVPKANLLAKVAKLSVIGTYFGFESSISSQSQIRIGEAAKLSPVGITVKNLANYPAFSDIRETKRIYLQTLEFVKRRVAECAELKTVRLSALCGSAFPRKDS